ncbi:MAG: CPBP family intramembrane glutamate endopeptidase, partial [Stackebrandtia sp.]
MSDRAAAPQPLHLPALRRVVAGHPVTAFLVLLYAVTGGLALIPALTEPTPLPNDGHLYGMLTSVIGCTGSAFLVTAVAGGRAAVRDLASRCLRWRVRLRWYAVALLGMPLATL